MSKDILTMYDQLLERLCWISFCSYLLFDSFERYLDHRTLISSPSFVLPATFKFEPSGYNAEDLLRVIEELPLLLLVHN
jgi:hypothetical protein